MTEPLHVVLSQVETDRLSDEDVQRLVAAAVRLYAERRASQPELAPLPESPDGSAVLASECLVLVSAILEAVQVELFEVGLWRALGAA